MKFERPIAFYPDLARELGGIGEAIYYQQIHFWSDKGNREDGFIYKSKEEIEHETTLTRDQQDRIRTKLTKMGWIEVKKVQAPNGAPTLHYRPLIALSIVGKPANAKVQNPLMHSRETHESSIAEITTENTTDTLSADFEAFWQQYPRKTAKKAALLAWRRAKIPQSELPSVLAALAEQKKSQQWTKDGGRFIPHPATWINQERWKDETTIATTPASRQKKYAHLS